MRDGIGLIPAPDRTQRVSPAYAGHYRSAIIKLKKL